MNLAADLDEFIALHREHGRLTPNAGEQTPNGYRLEIACPCGVTFERWVTAEDAIDNFLRERRRSKGAMSRHLLTAFGIVLIFVTGGLVTARVLGPRVGLERPWVEGALIGACAVLGIVTANKITRGRRSKPNSRPQ